MSKNRSQNRKDKLTDDVYPFKNIIRMFKPRWIDHQYFTLVHFAAHPKLQRTAKQCVGPHWLTEAIISAKDAENKDYTKAKEIIKNAVDKKLIKFSHGDLRLGSFGKRVSPQLESLHAEIVMRLRPIITMFSLSVVALLFWLISWHFDPGNPGSLISEACGDVFMAIFIVQYYRHRTAQKAKYAMLRGLMSMRLTESKPSRSAPHEKHKKTAWIVWKRASPRPPHK